MPIVRPERADSRSSFMPGGIACRRRSNSGASSRPAISSSSIPRVPWNRAADGVGAMGVQNGVGQLLRCGWRRERPGTLRRLVRHLLWREGLEVSTVAITCLRKSGSGKQRRPSTVDEVTPPALRRNSRRPCASHAAKHRRPRRPGRWSDEVGARVEHLLGFEIEVHGDARPLWRLPMRLVISGAIWGRAELSSPRIFTMSPSSPVLVDELAASSTSSGEHRTGDKETRAIGARF